MRHMAMRNQIHMPQGRTLVELAQARAGGREFGGHAAGSDTELEKVRARTAITEVARWDPEKDDMPSPFLRKGAKPIR
jgi:NIMA (never in mitosis gene a)-related kinase 2